MGWQCDHLPSRTENDHYRVSGPSGLLNDTLFSPHSGSFTAEKAEAGDSEWFASDHVNCGCLSTHHSASSDLGVCSSRTPQTCSVFLGLLIFISALSCGNDDGVEPTTRRGNEKDLCTLAWCWMRQELDMHSASLNMGHSQEPVRDFKRS